MIVSTSCSGVLWCALLVLGLAACDDMSAPADLDREQVLAIRSTPKTPVAGESVVLDSLLAGPDGPFTGDTTWELAAPAPGLSIATLKDGRALITADEGFAAEAPIEVYAAIARPDGPELLALKNISVSTTAGANPQIAALNVAGMSAPENGSLTVTRGETALAGDAPADALVAWYTSIGEIQYYRDAETSIEITEDDAESGWLAVVVRDNAGGVAWHACELHVR